MFIIIQLVKVFTEEDSDQWVVSLDNYKDCISVFKMKHKLEPVLAEAEAYLLK